LAGPAHPAPVRSIALRLAEAQGLLSEHPARAAALAREILRAEPRHPVARLLLGAALRRSGEVMEAMSVLSALSAEQPGAWGPQLELGVAMAVQGEIASAVAALTRATHLNPRSSLAWHALGDQRLVLGDRAGAQEAHGKAQDALGDRRLAAGVEALADGRAIEGWALLRAGLNLHRSDVAAKRLLSDVAVGLGRPEAALALLAEALAEAPGFLPARFHAAILHLQAGRPEAALAQIEQALAQRSGVTDFLALRGAIHVQLGEAGAAVEDFAAALASDPAQPRVWVSYGHALKMAGRQAEAVAAYRRSLSLAPTLGEAYWSLANLKTWRFGDEDMAQMKALSARPDLTEADRAPLHFALGKGLEDQGRYEAAFAQYRRGNALRRAETPYDAAANRAFVERLIAIVTPDFLAARAGAGCPAPDPIFVVGLPRSGSTLVEQILASHSAVEGASELPDLTRIARQLGQAGSRLEGAAYPEALSELVIAAFEAMGQDYLAGTRPHRRLARPFFVDKFPNNFMHVGLIHLLLPRARIIDVRRHPLGCCLSVFKQNFAEGQAYSYDLADLGRYYANYVELMSHFDAVLPGRIYRQSYEALVEDPEGQVRGLLAYCGLPFEDQCLRFYESGRAVRTASSEQVRRPIFRDGLDQWRRFEPWLGPLKAALGPVLAPSQA